MADDFQSFLSWFITQLELDNYIVYEDRDIGKIFQLKSRDRIQLFSRCSKNHVSGTFVNVYPLLFYNCVARKKLF